MRAAWGGVWAAVAGLLVAGAVAASRDGAAFLNQPLSVRQMGMGNVSAVEGDPLRAWSNPAMLVTQQTQGALGMSGGALFDRGETVWGMGLSCLLRPNVAVGLLASSLSFNVDEVNALGDPTGRNLERGGLAIGPAMAVQWRWLSMGAAAKYVSEKTAGESDSGWAHDLGIGVKLGPARLIAAERNLGLEGLPESRLGATYSLEKIRLTLGAEYVRPEARRPQMGVGAEWRAAKALVLRAGLADLNEVTQSMTLGLSAAYRGLSVDYAFGMHSLGATHRVSLSWSFGPTAAALALPAPVLDPSPSTSGAVTR